MTGLFSRLRGDRFLWVSIITLTLFSMLVVASAVGVLGIRYKGGEVSSYMFKHIIFLVMGFGVAYVVHRINPYVFRRAANIALLLAIVLLVITLVHGATINQARRWLVIPFTGLTFQTSAFAQVALLIYLASQLSRLLGRIKEALRNGQKPAEAFSLKELMVRVILPASVVILLIAYADLSTALMLATITFIMLFVSLLPLKYIFRIGAVVMLILALFIGAVMLLKVGRAETWKNRIERYIKGEPSYQVLQAQIAIANGGLLGRGVGKSVQRYFLPHPYSDYVYAIIVEEYGLIVGIIILVLYFTIMWRSIYLFTKANNRFIGLLILGIGLSITFQALLHIGVVSGLFPATGLPLPLISMGGTSILFTFFMMGMLLGSSAVVIEQSEGDGQTA